jgi:hypothetical protein
MAGLYSALTSGVAYTKVHSPGSRADTCKMVENTIGVMGILAWRTVATLIRSKRGSWEFN